MKAIHNKEPLEPKFLKENSLVSFSSQSRVIHFKKPLKLGKLLDLKNVRSF